MPKKTIKVGKKTPKVEKEQPKLQYSLEVQVNDIHYKGSATTLKEALENFIKSPQFPFAIKSRCLVRYGDENKEKQIVWPALRAHRQFRLLSLKPTQVEFQTDKWLSDLAQ